MPVEELERLCVDGFEGSATRRDIMAGLVAIYERARQVGLPGSIWVDGSFLTEKSDPNDVDVVFWFPQVYYEDGTEQQQEYIRWLTSNEEDPKASFRCDTYAEPIVREDEPEYDLHVSTMEYWRDAVLGFAANSGKPKGIAVLSLDELES